MSDLDGANGFHLSTEGDVQFAAVSGAGDVTGDGIDDVIVALLGEFETTPYVVFGKDAEQPNTAPFAATIPLATLDGSDGFGIEPVEEVTVGRAVSGGGDINGDGISDLVLSAFGVYEAEDAQLLQNAAVVFGKTSAFGATFDLRSLDGANGFSIADAGLPKYFGSVSSAGDINGDGVGDLIVGVGGGGASKTFVVFGKKAPASFESPLTPATLDATNGFFIKGPGEPGAFVSAAGDVNGDGIDDLVLSAPKLGTAYVIFGLSAGGSGFGAHFDLASLNGTNGFSMSGVEPSSEMPVHGAGDVNGDGASDLVIGNKGESKSYLVFGKKSGMAANVDLTTLDGTDGFTVNGKEGEFAGWDVNTAGDLNGDGLDDFAVGDPANNRVAVIFGRDAATDPFNASLELNTLGGVRGFFVTGPDMPSEGVDDEQAAVSGMGMAVAPAGDVNGDGFADLVAGAEYAASAYVIFGGRRTTAPP